MELEWTLSEFTAYLRSWSAVARFNQELGFDPVDSLEAGLRPLWGAQARKVSWPLSGGWAAEAKKRVHLVKEV